MEALDYGQGGDDESPHDVRFKGEILGEPAHPMIVSLVALWRTKCAEGQLPQRADFSMRDLKDHLPSLIFAEPVDGGADYLFRYCGSRMESRFGFRLQGRTLLGTFAPPGGTDYLARYQHAARTGAPFFRRGRYEGTPSECFDYELTLLPLRPPEGGEGNWIMAAQFEYAPGKTPRTPQAGD